MTGYNSKDAAKSKGVRPDYADTELDLEDGADVKPHVDEDDLRTIEMVDEDIARSTGSRRDSSGTNRTCLLVCDSVSDC